ncbi:hypothetical protein [Phycobacter azelaicus]|uniref:hypothetical protein n=1 Tax=Phycobacter azelaicus TaxID=2668075 RepID=UPI001867F723|nr:hypothetical protein [Phycobacter azelaicus]MBE1295992.1 hypothetical protein [Paracoccaceae bacterium]
MTRTNLTETALRLEKEIRDASGSARAKRIDEFLSVMSRLRRSGEEISAKLRRVEYAMAEEATEDRFDNMPV